MSVSDVLRYFMNEDQKAAIERYRGGENGWEKRGNELHATLEKLLNGKEVKAEGKFADWIDALKNCDLFKNSEILATEFALCDEEKSIGGSFDFLLKKENGEIILGDLKTTSSEKAAKYRKPATEQLGAYASMLKQHRPKIKIDKCCTLVLGPNVCRPIEQDPKKCLEAWNKVWMHYQVEHRLNEDF